MSNGFSNNLIGVDTAYAGNKYRGILTNSGIIDADYKPTAYKLGAAPAASPGPPGRDTSRQQEQDAARRVHLEHAIAHLEEAEELEGGELEVELNGQRHPQLLEHGALRPALATI